MRVFRERASAAGELKTIRGADPHLEIGALFELSHEHLYPPVLLFEDMKGCEPGHRILCNVRVARFVVGDLTLEAVKAYRRRPKEETEPIPPRPVNTGPVLENVDEGDAVDIMRFPQRVNGGRGGIILITQIPRQVGPANKRLPGHGARCHGAGGYSSRSQARRSHPAQMVGAR
jgi:4-hydroxy-3-polyprenylbenzoate decarboxylase